ncbi:MAG TPA: Uma2 family endonuclease, partial [Polyangiaceae bacterium]
MVAVTVLDPGPWGGKGLPGQDDLPCDDGEPMETSFHHAQGNLLIDSLVYAWNDRHDFYVAGNMFIYFSEHQIKRNDFRGPDVFVVLGTERTPRKSWVTWEEGGKRPDVVFEVISESTESVDRGEKMRLYAAVWRTPFYFIFDPETEQLDGYRLDVDRQ